MKVLVADGDKEGQELLKKLLQDYGHEIAAVDNGTEVLRLAKLRPPDMIISDILMAKMDGFQLCRACKQNKQLKNIPFVFYTDTHTVDKDEEFALSLGADAFIRKPAEPDAFLQILTDVFEKAKAGTLTPPKVTPLEPTLFLTEYARRIIAKLEDKMTQLQMEITERKRVGEALRASESKLSSVLSSMVDLVFVLDKDSRFTSFYVPSEEPYVSPEKFVGEKYSEVMPSHIHKLFAEAFNKNKKGKVAEYEYWLEIEGKTKWYSVKSSPMLANGEFTGCVAVARNITEHKQAEEKTRELQVLREVDSLRSQLLANISHELRTPLTSIKGFVSTLLRTDVEWSEEEKHGFLETIDQESDRLSRLIGDLLDMSRIDAGALRLEKHNYQISEVLDSVSSRLASLTEHHQLQLVVPSGLPSVFVDQMRIGQVLTNLVENATKFSSEGSLIRIEAQLAGDQLIISVTDKGEGIPAELLDRVFDRFYQAENIVNGRKSGTGLGLSICRGILEAHDGRIWVESKLGEGPKFSFSLPVSKEE